MTRSITVRQRGIALLAGVAAAAAFGLAGCGTGQYAETANKRSSVPGNGAEFALRANGPDGAVVGRVYVRNLLITYRGTEGYPAGGAAPVEMHLVNESAEPVTVRISLVDDAGAGADPQLVRARDVRLTGGSGGEASPPATLGGTISPRPGGQNATPTAGSTEATADAGASPTATAGEEPAGRPSSPAEPTGTDGQPAEVQVPARGVVVLAAEGDQVLRVQGLAGTLRTGGSVLLRFDVTGSGIAPTGTQLSAPVGLPQSPAPRPTPEPGGHEE